MGYFVVEGGRELSGHIKVSGSKNGALPILFASICVRGVSVIRNLPDITDVRCALKILECLGALIDFKDNTAVIDTSEMVYDEISDGCVSSLRASTYLLGSMLSRFSVADVMRYGGCDFSSRPIDLHLYALKCLGAVEREGRLYLEDGHGGEIRFPLRTVGATVNALILSSTIPEESRIYNYSMEPHIFNLIEYLNSCGAEITVLNDYIRVIGAQLTGGEVTVRGDMIEAGSYLALSMMSGMGVSIGGFCSSELMCVLPPLEMGGASFGIGTDTIYPIRQISTSLNIHARPYPDFPTDLQPVFAPLMAYYYGGSITDHVWQSRYGYLSSLSNFGVRYSLSDGAEIYSSRIVSANSRCVDLRGGMACLMCALAAEGRSVIHRGELVLRGYENLCEKLRSVGAVIDYFAE